MSSPRNPIQRVRCLVVLLLAVQATACSSPASAPLAPGQGDALSELADPLGPAELYANTFTLASSWDPGGPQRSVIFAPLNDDYNVFERDCRKVKKGAPGIVVFRELGVGCPGSVSGLVMAHATGPGVVSRIWMTTLPLLSKGKWEDERLQIYLDRTDRPSISLTFAELEAGAAPFLEPESGIRSASWVTYQPLHFKHSLWITLEDPKVKVYYYQANIVSGALPASAPRAWPVSSEPVWQSARAGSLYAASGAGGLQTLGFEADSTAAAGRLRHAKLTFAFDGIESTAEVGDLCASSIEWSPWQTGRMDVSVGKDDKVTCILRWGWPHANSGSISLAATDTTGIRFTTSAIPSGDPLPAGRFFVVPAAHAVSEPALMQWGSVQGNGRLVALTLQGTALPDHNLYKFSQVPLNFLEGDEFIWIDGELKALGTGTEDLFNGAFYFETGPYSWPWGGVSLVEEEGDLGRVQTTRFFLGADQISFQESFDGKLEIGANHPDIPHDYRTLAIFYLRP